MVWGGALTEMVPPGGLVARGRAELAALPPCRTEPRHSGRSSSKGTRARAARPLALSPRSAGLKGGHERPQTTTRQANDPPLPARREGYRPHTAAERKTGAFLSACLGILVARRRERRAGLTTGRVDRRTRRQHPPDPPPSWSRRIRLLRTAGSML